MNNNKNKGFTLIELLVAVGFISVASVSTYNIANYANDFRIISNETNELTDYIKDIQRTTLTTAFTDETLKTIRSFKSELNLKSITAKNGNLLFNYGDVKTRICVDFVNKIITSNINVDAIINTKKVSRNNLIDISNSCFSDKNDVSIVLNKSFGYTIDTIVASVNPPQPNNNTDVINFPNGEFSIVPVVPAFVPSTANPLVYGIDGTAPIYPNIPTATAGGSVVLGSDYALTNPLPAFVPPVLPPAPPATPAPADDIDQNPLPPPPPPNPAQGVNVVKGDTLNICKNAGLSFNWYGNSLYGNATLYTPIQYFEKYGNWGEFTGHAVYQAYYNNVLNLLSSKNPSLNSWKCTANFFDDIANW